jgi:AraC-like DNA-binding protein
MSSAVAVSSAPPSDFSALDATQSQAILADRYTTVLLNAAARQGLDPAALFGDEPIFSTRGRRRLWTHDDLGLVSGNLRRAADDEMWGLGSDGKIPMGTFRFACELFLISSSLGDALARVFKLYDLLGAIRFRLEVEGAEASITVIPSAAEPVDVAFLREWFLWIWHYTAQWFVRAEIALPKVEFPHAAIPDPVVYNGTFGSKCSFGAKAARIVFPADDLARPITRSPAELEDFLARRRVTLTYAPDVERSVSTSVKVALLRSLQRNKSLPTLEELAAERAVSGQTLRRWLVAEGTSYRDLKAEVRGLIARHQLSRPDVSLSEIAASAGFAETSGFTRAFRTWTGMNVSQFRRAVAEGVLAKAEPAAVETA